MQQLTSVKITYISYQSISRDEAASIYSVIVDIIRPLERLFKLSEVTGKVIEIEPTSRQNIERTLELDNYVPSSNPQFHLLKFEFESFTLHIDPDPDEPKYYIEEK